jgi:hypothetical protein
MKRQIQQQQEQQQIPFGDDKQEKATATAITSDAMAA